MSPARLLAASAVVLLTFVSRAADPEGFSLEQILSARFAADILASPNGRALAWVSNARDRRNVWLAEARFGAGPFKVRALTHFGADDGLDVSELAFVPNHDALLYVPTRGRRISSAPGSAPGRIERHARTAPILRSPASRLIYACMAPEYSARP